MYGAFADFFCFSDFIVCNYKPSSCLVNFSCWLLILFVCWGIGPWFSVRKLTRSYQLLHTRHGTHTPRWLQVALHWSWNRQNYWWELQQIHQVWRCFHCDLAQIFLLLIFPKYLTRTICFRSRSKDPARMAAWWLTMGKQSKVQWVEDSKVWISWHLFTLDLFPMLVLCQRLLELGKDLLDV